MKIALRPKAAQVNAVEASGSGIAGCFTLRMLAVYDHWNLPGAAGS
jgi:hypothetical protein